MASNNPSKSKNTSIKTSSSLNRSQEISSLEDSESTTSLHENRKNVTIPTSNEQQKIISSCLPNSFNNNVNLNTNSSSRQYPNVNPHGTVLNDTRVVTYQNPMNVNPTTMQPIKFHPNFSHAPYLQPAPGIAMNPFPVMNQHNLSQPIHSPFPS